MTTITRILLVDDHPMLRKGLRLLIDSEEGLSVVGEASDGQESIARLRELTPDIVVMDINLPNLNGIEATRQILSESPQTRILALSIHSGKEYVEKMIEAGASGYILKESAPEELIKAIRVISEGKSFVSADITEIVLARLRQSQRTGGEVARDLNTLTCKLRRPDLGATIVHRALLIEKLENGREKRLTLLIAPAGFGKTTLVSDWLANSGTLSAWLTADRNDSRLLHFLETMMASIRTLYPDSCPNVQALVGAANQAPISILFSALSKDIEQCAHRFILAIDDYHLIEDKSVQDLCSLLLKNPLEQMHLVIISRRDPFLPIPSLRDANDINELRMDDLLFSEQDTITFLEQNFGQEVDPGVVSEWMIKTRGWVQGLQLAISSTEESAPSNGASPGKFTNRNKASAGRAEWRELLTNREYEILLLLKQRLSDKEISKQMYISTGTVKTHTKNIRRKLDAVSRRDAVAKAITLNLLPPD